MPAPAFHHVPVLLRETVRAWLPHPAIVGRYARPLFVDCTVGGAGHSVELLSRCPSASLLCFDRDADALAAARARLQSVCAQPQRIHTVHASYTQLSERLEELSAEYSVMGILADLGVSSHQLDTPTRGFSFRLDGPLDMRFNAQDRQAVTAADLVNTLPEAEVARIIRDYGEDRYANRIAGAIAARRARMPFTRTADLASVVASAVPPQPPARGASKRTHPATQTFQALRIAVNDELRAVHVSSTDPQGRAASFHTCWVSVQTLMAEAPRWLAVGGRLAIISFHSLEDRIVKTAMRALVQRGCTSIAHGEAGDQSARFQYPMAATGANGEGEDVAQAIPANGLAASDHEIETNPRARSARLRAVERVA